MLKITFSNVEDLVFSNHDIKYNLPDYKSLFDEYFFYKKIGDINKIKKIKLNFINSLKENHISFLSNYFKDQVVVIKLQDNITKNLSFDLSSFIEDDDLSYKDFCIYRNKNKFFVTFWR